MLTQPRWTHVAIPVSDLDRAIEFYTTLTPLVVVARNEDDTGRGVWLSNDQRALDTSAPKKVRQEYVDTQFEAYYSDQPSALFFVEVTTNNIRVSFLAYALSLVSLGTSIATFGLDRSITRFVPIYDEQGNYGKLWGTIVLAGGLVTSVGLLCVALVYGLQGILGGSPIGNSNVSSILLVLVLLVPIQGLDGLLVGMFAVFSKPRAIFFRKYVLGIPFRNLREASRRVRSRLAERRRGGNSAG